MPKLIAPKSATSATKFSKLDKELANRPKPVSLWAGPNDPGPNGGITQTALSRFLCCRERFRLYMVEGLRPKPAFSHRLEYGNLFHAAEEATAAGRPWKQAVQEYAQKLIKTYRNDGAEIEKWYRVLCVQYPIYLTYWAKHPDQTKRQPIFQEKQFHVEYVLPSGRVVYLRGKFDSVDAISRGIWLQENKARGELDEEKLTNELGLDLQTNIYLAALERTPLGKFDGLPIKGVRYNVVRRPLSYGKHNIKQLQGRKLKSGEIKGAETLDQFYDRLDKEVIRKFPQDFFLRLKVEVTYQDTENFQSKVLTPTLEQLCDWWDWIKNDPFDPWRNRRGYATSYMYQPMHFIYPSGVWNPALEGRTGDLDRYLLTGDVAGLERTKTLFPELVE